jgi:hypothetical protein
VPRRYGRRRVGFLQAGDSYHTVARFAAGSALCKMAYRVWIVITNQMIQPSSCAFRRLWAVPMDPGWLRCISASVTCPDQGRYCQVRTPVIVEA